MDAEQVKALADKLAVIARQVATDEEVVDVLSVVAKRSELHTAIDAMQAEIDRLRKDVERAHRYERLLIGCRSAMRAAGQRANYATDWQHMVASIDAALSEETKGR